MSQGTKGTTAILADILQLVRTRLKDAKIAHDKTSAAIEAAKPLWEKALEENRVITTAAVEAHMRTRLEATQKKVDDLAAKANEILAARKAASKTKS